MILNIFSQEKLFIAMKLTALPLKGEEATEISNPPWGRRSSACIRRGVREYPKRCAQIRTLIVACKRLVVFWILAPERKNQNSIPPKS